MWKTFSYYGRCAIPAYYMTKELLPGQLWSDMAPTVFLSDVPDQPGGPPALLLALDRAPRRFETRAVEAKFLGAVHPEYS